MLSFDAFYTFVGKSLGVYGEKAERLYQKAGDDLMDIFVEVVGDCGCLDDDVEMEVLDEAIRVAATKPDCKRCQEKANKARAIKAARLSAGN